jgi:F0F1-type ATP synthase membrane subunit b/b'
MIRDSLRTAAGLDGPTDPKHIMSGEYATTGAILWWASIGFILTILLLFIVIWRWGKATGTDFAQRVQAASVAVRDHDAAKDKETKAMASLAEAERKVKETQDDSAKQKAQQDRDEKERQAGAQRALREAANTEALAAIRAIREGGADEASDPVGGIGRFTPSRRLVGQVRRQPPAQA